MHGPMKPIRINATFYKLVHFPFIFDESLLKCIVHIIAELIKCLLVKPKDTCPYISIRV